MPTTTTGRRRAQVSIYSTTAFPGRPFQPLGRKQQLRLGCHSDRSSVVHYWEINTVDKRVQKAHWEERKREEIPAFASVTSLKLPKSMVLLHSFFKSKRILSSHRLVRQNISEVSPVCCSRTRDISGRVGDRELWQRYQSSLVSKLIFNIFRPYSDFIISDPQLG